MDLKKLQAQLTELKSISSSNEKADFVKRYYSDPQFALVVRFLLNPYVLTGISKKKALKSPEGFTDMGKYYTLEDMLTYFQINKTGRDIDIKIMQNFISAQAEEYRDMLLGICTKTLKLGIDSTWNKNVPDTYKIPEFACQLAKDFYKNEKKVKSKRYAITLKLDGLRCLFIKERGITKAFTRTGQPYDGMELFEKLFNESSLDNFVWDGELLSEIIGDTNEVFADTSGKARSKGKNKTGLIFNCFDMLPLNEFSAGESSLKYFDRREAMKQFETQLDTNLIKILPVLYEGDDYSKIEEFKQWAIDNGQEGIMINLDTTYKTKRVDSLLKVKVFKEADLRVIELIEGQGENEGVLGAVTVQFIHEDALHTCNCGSGFSREERQLYWRNPSLILNKIVTIKYFEISKNDDGGFGLRFPIWTRRIREDKTEISME